MVRLLEGAAGFGPDGQAIADVGDVHRRTGRTAITRQEIRLPGSRRWNGVITPERSRRADREVLAWRRSPSGSKGAATAGERHAATVRSATRRLSEASRGDRRSASRGDRRIRMYVWITRWRHTARPWRGWRPGTGLASDTGLAFWLWTGVPARGLGPGRWHTRCGVSDPRGTGAEQDWRPGQRTRSRTEDEAPASIAPMEGLARPVRGWRPGLTGAPAADYSPGPFGLDRFKPDSGRPDAGPALHLVEQPVFIWIGNDADRPFLVCVP